MAIPLKQEKFREKFTSDTNLQVRVEMEDGSVQLERTASGQTGDGLSDRVYLLASVIFQNNYLEKPAAQRLVNYGKERGLSLPEAADGEMQRAAYELAFNALKYQELLEHIILDSSFYLTQPLPDDQMSLIVVMLYDFQDRKFVPRKCESSDEFIKEVRDVELHLLRFTAKLAASLARWRIKHEVVSIECMLPESVRIRQQRASSLMLYAWVNSLKSSLLEVQSELKRAGFSRVRSVGQLEGKTFCQDPHCEDILVFPAEVKTQLDLTSLLSKHKLIVQDKACCLGPNAVCPLLQETENGDLLMAGCFSGLTVSHTASLIAKKQKSTGNDKSKILVCVGERTEAQREKLQQVVNAMGCKNVKLIPASFQSLDKNDKKFRKVRVILLAPKSSLSAISNPIEFILQEDRDTELLQDLAQGSIARSKLETLVVQQKKDIDHAMQFPKIQSVIYTTFSTHAEENEEVVRAVFEQARACGESIQTSLAPFSSPLDSEDSFLLLEPTKHNNGCFMAIFTREPPQQVVDIVTEEPAEVAETKSEKTKRKRSQARLKRRETKSNSSSGSGTSSKKNSVSSPKLKESAEVLLARITSRDSQKSPKMEKSKNWSNPVVRPNHLPQETVPKVKESAKILPKTHSSGYNRSPKLEPYGKSSIWNKAVHSFPAPRDLHKPTVISLPQVDFPALFPPHAHSRRMWPHFQSLPVKVFAHKVLYTRPAGW
ncbi:hypothetical protein WMY93_009668 [Mugilogobius chulae]|uniref:SAM-dependent MTase RsmB/NOP-type domain-containing protein n=1 Tax=Mugilogobius chulae TaxID=88201 RepID=A0AAW0PC80_9GOBI